MSKHWLKFGPAKPSEGPIVGCQCGFRASPDDNGWGDSVVQHLLTIERKKPLVSEPRGWRELQQPYQEQLLFILRRHDCWHDPALPDQLAELLNRVLASGPPPYSPDENS